MDSLITAAARALAAGDPLGALNRVALARRSRLRSRFAASRWRSWATWRGRRRSCGARRAPSARESRGPRAMHRRRSRDRARLARPRLACEGARRGAGNARRARRPCQRGLCAVSRGPAPAPDRPPRRGRAAACASSIPRSFPPALRAAYELVVAGIAMRRLRAAAARAALARAERAARHAAIPALTAEVESASLVLDAPAARLISRNEERLLLLDEVEALLGVEALVVDACRHVVRLRRRGDLAGDAVRCCSRWHARLPKPGRKMPRGRCSSPGHSGRGTPTSRIAPGCVWRSDGFAESCAALSGVTATRRGFALVPQRGARGRRAGAAGRRRACGGARPARRRRVVVELGTGACAWGQPAYRAAGARRACGGRQGPVLRSRAGATLDDPADAGIPDDLVTPRLAGRGLE